MPTIIKDTVQSIIKNLKAKTKDKKSATFKAFKKSLRPRERFHVRCVSLRDDIMTVNVDSSVWLYQLNQKKETLLKKLAIKDIKFRIGEIDKR